MYTRILQQNAPQCKKKLSLPCGKNSFHFFSEPSDRTHAVEAIQTPDNNKSEIVIAVTISQVRKGLTQQNPFVAPLL